MLQLILGTALVVFSLSQVRLHAFKYVALILVIFFVYDVFMVFLSPYLTGGNNVMEAVVNGGKAYSGVSEDWNKVEFGLPFDEFNRLPILLSIPNMHYFKKTCEIITGNKYTSLGLGDMLIPGVCINFSIIFDMASSNRYSIYFFANMLGYIIGLFLALLSYVFMNASQPALFYICPILLVINIFLPLFRKEFKEMWSGDTVNKYIDVNTGYMKNLTKYKVKKANAFNIMKIMREKNSVETVSGLPDLVRSTNSNFDNKSENNKSQ